MEKTFINPVPILNTVLFIAIVVSVILVIVNYKIKRKVSMNLFLWCAIIISVLTFIAIFFSMAINLVGTSI